MQVKKCERCGHDIFATKPKEIQDIKCSHCNKEYTITNKTKYLAFAIVVFIIFIFSFFSIAIATLLNISEYLLLFPLIVLSFFLYNWSLYILAKYNKLDYKTNS